MSKPSTLSPYRWIIEVLLLLLLIAQSLAWLAPAPILQEIRSGLGISLSSAGLIISIIALCIGIFSLLGAVVAERIGALRALLIGIWLMAIGQVASGYAPKFRRAARVPRARRRRLRAGDRAAGHAHDAMVRRRRMAVHQYDQLLLRLRRTDRGVPRDAGAVRGGRIMADDIAVVRRRLGGRRAVVDDLRPRASQRSRRGRAESRSKRPPSAARH